MYMKERYHRVTEDVDLYLEDTLENRKNLRAAFKELGLGDFEPIERIQFIPGWVDFQLGNGVKLSIVQRIRRMCKSWKKSGGSPKGNSRPASPIF